LFCIVCCSLSTGMIIAIFESLLSDLISVMRII
jgi:hypothetical protein